MKFKKMIGAAIYLIAAMTTAYADQSLLSSPTTGTVSGLTLTQNYNGALNALASCNSGASTPANTLSGVPVAGQCWLNTATSRYKLEIYDGSTWVVQATLDPVNHQWLPQTGGGSTTLASASAIDIGSVAETFITITGTTAITSFGSSAPVGNIKIISAQSTGLVLTFGSGTLILPGAANITMGAGDTAITVYLGSGVWKIVDYQVAVSPANIRQVGTSANNLVALDSAAKLPAVDGSQLTGISATGRLLRAPQILTSGTTYTAPAGCTSIYVEVVAGGGGGAGASGSNASSGGGGGGYAAKLFSVSPSTAYSYLIGAPGNAGSSGSAGGTGGTTSFTVGGVTVSASGGVGGQPNNGGRPGAGGIGSSGDFNISGNAGQQMAQYSTSYYPASGGGSFFGGGGGPGLNGGNYGGGGGGGNVGSAGGAGAQGVIRIWEFS